MDDEIRKAEIRAFQHVYNLLTDLLNKDQVIVKTAFLRNTIKTQIHYLGGTIDVSSN